MSISQIPVYNLKAVLKETGIAADTLRAWERRYGLPKPQRTPGGHRLYSEHDIRLIKWLISKQAEGLSISRAVELWRDQSSAGRDPLSDKLAAGPSSSGALPAASLESLRSEWLSACMAYNEAAAEQVLNQAFALYPVETVLSGLLQAGLHELGELWFQGRCSVQQEHFISALATRRLDALIAASPPPARAETILLACPPDEWHSLPLLMLSLLVRRRGWRVLYLGANVPLIHLEKTLDAVKPALVVMNAQGLIAAASLYAVARSLAQSRLPFAFGGRIFERIPALQDRFPGVYLGASLEGSLSRLEELVAQPTETVAPMDSASSSLAASFHLHMPLIEGILQKQFDHLGLSLVDFEIATAQMGDLITAALELGDIRYLEADLYWIHDMLATQRIPAGILRGYLSAYADAIRQVMGLFASDVSDWLDNYSSRLDD